MSGLLAGYRVLELADRRGWMAGRVLADFGAEVVAVELPQDFGAGEAGAGGEGVAGDAAALVEATRRHLRAGKRSVRLDPATRQGREALRALLRGSDVLVTTAPAAWLARLGLAGEDLEAVNPSLVHVSLTPFGLEGPKAGWTGADEVVLAGGGLLSIAGAAGERPCLPPETQGEYFGSYIVLLAAVTGLHARGQRPFVADVAMQEAVASQEHLLPAWLNHGEVIARSGSQHKSVAPASVFETADGYVFLFVSRVHWGAFLECWAGHPPEFDEEVWYTNEHRRANVGTVNEAVTRFTRSHRTADLVALLQARGIPCLALQSPADYVRHDFASRRGFIASVAVPGGGQVPLHAAPFTVDGERPRPGAVAAPGSDTDQVLGEVAAAPARPAAAVPGGGTAALPLAGVRVLALTTGIAGPLTGRNLALLGAEVVKVESRRGGIDSFRYFGGAKDLDSSPRFAEMNSNVRSVSLNLKTPAGRQLAGELAAVSDVVLDNFRPKVAERLGLGASALRERKPDVVVLKMPGFEASGPLSDFASWGPTLGAFSGLSWTWNHPGADPPVGFQGSYPDYVAAAFGTALVLAALLRREATGAGAEIELSQCEATSFSIGGTVAAAAAGVPVTPRGNRCLYHAPCGIFRTKGEDRWCAISVASREQWSTLCDLLGAPRLAGRDRTDVDPGEIERLTSGEDADLLATKLQSAGVAASPVADGRDLAGDDHLAARRFVSTIDDPSLGLMRLPRLPVLLPEGTVLDLHPAPRFGEATRHVVREVLGHGEEDYRRWAADGVLE